MRVTVEKELGTWTVRLNGHFIADFWLEAEARRLAMNIEKALIAR